MSDTTSFPGSPDHTSSGHGEAPTPGTATSDSLRDLLSRVAAGEVDPAEAARLLDHDATVPTVDRDTVVVPTASSSVGAISVVGGGVKLVVIADPGVATAVADGPHSVRQEGETLVIEAPSTDGYQVREAPKYLGWVTGVWTGGRGEKITVRVNPDLPLTVQATACSVDISGVHASLTVNADAASVKVREHRGAVHGTARMCSVSIKGAVTGDSSFLCEFGSINLRLDPGSDVVVTAVSEMGSLKLGGGEVSQDDSGMRMRGSAGSGPHAFDLTVRMGSASVVAA
jgi:hypothetical protein